MWILNRRGLVLATALAIALGLAASARAATTYTVNTTADNAPSGSECSGVAGDCALRQALNKAVSGDTVFLPANASPYQIVSGQISIPTGVTIAGAGASTTKISGGGTSEAFTLTGGAGTSVIRNLTIDAAANTTATDQAGAINGNSTENLTLQGVTISNSTSHGGFGGALEIGSAVVIAHSRLINDSSSGSGGGGAIDSYSGSSGSLVISDTVFANDSTAGNGGAILLEGSNTLSVKASTFSQNSAPSGTGGAIKIDNPGPRTIENTTLTGNSASTGGAVDAGSATLVNDTLAGNIAATGANLNASTSTVMNTIFASPSGGGANCSGTVTTAGHNLEDTTPSTCGLSAPAGDKIGVNPSLGAPGNNASIDPTAGGPPQTMAIGPGSPALQAANAAGCSTVGSVDERGFPRPGIEGSACDIGAFEYLPPVATRTTLSSSTPAQESVMLTAVVAATRSLASAVPGISGTVSFRSGSKLLGSPAVVGGRATFKATLKSLTKAVTASYSGDTIYSTSSSSPLSPAISRLKESHRRFKAGKKRGTTFSFTLNTVAKLTLKFIAKGKPHKVLGKLSISHGHAGRNHIKFDGRLSRTKRLKPGRYTLVMTATNAAGHSSSRKISFTIV